MRVGLQTWGSEGDLRPFFALARGLARAGHEVTLQYSGLDERTYPELLGDASFRHQRVGSLGLPEAELTALVRRVFAEPNPVRQLSSILGSLLEPMIPAMTAGARELAATSDVLVHHMMAYPLAVAAEARKKPLVVVLTAPMIATRAFPVPGAPNLGVLNLLTWKLGLAVLDRQFLPAVARTRAELGLGRIRRVAEQGARSVLELCAVSPSLLPRPADWPEKAKMTGFLGPVAHREGEVLPEPVEAFLRAGPPPVFVTFGSMTVVEREAEAVFATVLEALGQVGCRAIVQAGSTRVEARPGVLVVGGLNHDAVFPRCAAVVHHGGSGTTHAVLRAGKPSVVVAHIVDQFLWGQVLERHGVAPRLVTRRGMRAGVLAAAVKRALEETGMREAAARLGEKVRAEDGVGTAVKWIEGVGVGR